MTDLNPKTFDLVAALAGRTYPEETVPVFFDEALSYRLEQLEKKIRLEGDSKTLKELTSLRDELLEKAKAATIKVHIKSVPSDIIKATYDKLDADFPVETGTFGQVKSNPEREAATVPRVWELYIQSIEGPDGSVLEPVTQADIKMFTDKAPDSAVRAVDRAIDALRTDSQKGYESAIRDLDFLSRP